MKVENIDGSYLTYKGKPLVRKGNDLFYGDLSDEYYLSMMIMSQKKVSVGDQSVEVPDTILVQVCSKDGKPVKQKLVKEGLCSKDGKPVKQKLVKEGLYEAFDLGCVWLEKMLVS